MSYKWMVDSFKESFTTITFDKVPHDHNQAADAMATIASLLDLMMHAKNEAQDKFKSLVY